jgi:hypothetical protein
MALCFVVSQPDCDISIWTLTAARLMSISSGADILEVGVSKRLFWQISRSRDYARDSVPSKYTNV